jgi:squalene-hopene/tetraprenyl-beta-curcumene cyclase
LRHQRWRLLGALALGALLCACSHRAHETWSPERAARYLDAREAWWSHWGRAQRDEATFCISCHTALPYALARPALSPAAASAPAAQRLLLENVTRRVTLWSVVKPYYPNQASASRATEAVLNALILTSDDQRRGHLSATTRSALEQMWSLQERSGASAGAWPWIEFNNEPWEAYDSTYYGAVLAALAVGTAPDEYAASEAIQAPLAALRGYLIRTYPAQSTLNRIMLLWASTRLPGLLDCDRRSALIAQIWKSQRADGGWSTGTLLGTWKMRDGSPLVTRSDGFATGLILLALRDTGWRQDARMERARVWLIGQQGLWSGRWLAASLNRHHDRVFDPAARFMDDAATAFAVLALTPSREPVIASSCRPLQTLESANESLRRFM